MVKDEHSDTSREPEILRTLSHPNIQKFIDRFEDHDEVHIVTDFCQGCDLQQVAFPFSTAAIEEVIASLADAIRYLHANDVAHCDIRAENVILAPDGCTAVLIDFGAAVRLSAFPRIADALVQEDWRALFNLQTRLLQAADTIEVFTASHFSTF